VTIQVIERHIVRGLDNIFSPIVVNGMSDKEVTAIASESALLINERDFLEDKAKKLRQGRAILRGVMESA
jgi:hypothetical protein